MYFKMQSYLLASYFDTALYLFSKELRLCFKLITQLDLSLLVSTDILELTKLFCSRLLVSLCKNSILDCFQFKSCLAISSSTFKLCISKVRVLLWCTNFFISFQQPADASLMYSSFILFIYFCCLPMFCISQYRSSSISIFLFWVFGVVKGEEKVLFSSFSLSYLFKSLFYLYNSAALIISSPFSKLISVTSRSKRTIFFLYYYTSLLISSLSVYTQYCFFGQFKLSEPNLPYQLKFKLSALKLQLCYLGALNSLLSFSLLNSLLYELANLLNKVSCDCTSAAVFTFYISGIKGSYILFQTLIAEQLYFGLSDYCVSQLGLASLELLALGLKFIFAKAVRLLGDLICICSPGIKLCLSGRKLISIG